MFWVDVFVWTYDPRKEPTTRPFILYPFQESVFMELLQAIRHGGDRLIEKSRDMGATWLCLTAFTHVWLFEPNTPLLIVSRKEDLVDRRGDPDALFWKIDYLLNRLPAWMIPPFTRNSMQIINMTNGSVISGDSTTGDVARGGRRKAILLDEFASVDTGAAVLAATADATPCRIFNSTPKGVGNAFSDIRRSGKVKVITLPWWQHPEKGAGLYYDDQGRPRSPWYDAECARRTSKREIAQELDIDYLSSGDMFFDATILARIKTEDVRPPCLEGDLVYRADPETSAVSVEGFRRDGGKRRLRLWLNLDSKGNPPRDRNYVLGIDVSIGQGVSNSVISVADTLTREKVAELSDPHVPPHELARYAVALGQWFGGQIGFAYLCWEANGPGLIFGKEVQRCGYPCIHWRRQEEGSHPRDSSVPGWHSSRVNKELLLGAYRAALARHELVNRCEESINEALDYIYYPNGSLGPARLVEDTSGARKAHGDRVIADALCVLALAEQPKARLPERPIPERSFAGRRRRWLAEQKDDRWND